MRKDSMDNADKYENGVDCATKFFAEYGDFIYKVIYSQVENKEQADDIYKDFFLSLVYRPVPTNIQNIKSYLYKAITNDIIDCTRRIEKYKGRMHRYAERLKYSPTEDNPENALIRKEETDKIVGLIERRLRPSEAQDVIEKPEKLLAFTSYWIPRKHREAIVGDIMEDCQELRALGKSELRICIHVIWQLAIALILLRPAALMDAFKRICSMK